MCRLTEQDVLCLRLSQDGLKYPHQGLGQLLFQVVLCVDGNGVLQHIDRVLKATCGRTEKEANHVSSGFNVNDK